MSEWILQGDVNFLDYGGIIMRRDEDDPNCYDVIEVATSWDTDELDENEVYAWQAYVDIDDSWVDWEAVESFSGGDWEDDSAKIADAIRYYGIAQWDARNLDGTQAGAGKMTKAELTEVLEEIGAGEYA